MERDGRSVVVPTRPESYGGRPFPVLTDDAVERLMDELAAEVGVDPLEIREQYEKQLKDLQEAYGEAMLELRARKKLAALMEREDDK